MCLSWLLGLYYLLSLSHDACIAAALVGSIPEKLTAIVYMITQQARVHKLLVEEGQVKESGANDAASHCNSGM